MFLKGVSHTGLSSDLYIFVFTKQAVESSKVQPARRPIWSEPVKCQGSTGFHMFCTHQFVGEFGENNKVHMPAELKSTKRGTVTE